MRRRWWVAGAVAVFVLAGAGTGIEVAAGRYQPLVISAYFVGATGTEDKVGSFDEPTYDFPYVEGGTLSFGIWLENTGRWGVRITAVDLPSPHLVTLLRPEEVRIGRLDVHPMTTDKAGTEPFHPFDLAPGADRLIMVIARMQDCSSFAPGGSTGINAVPLHFSAFGMDHHDDFPLGEDLRVVAPSADDCARGKTITRPAD